MLLWLDGSLILKRPALAKRTGRHVHRTDCQAPAGSSADLPASAPSLPCAGPSAPSAVSASDPPPCSASPFSPSFSDPELAEFATATAEIGSATLREGVCEDV